MTESDINLWRTVLKVRGKPHEDVTFKNENPVIRGGVGAGEKVLKSLECRRAKMISGWLRHNQL